jgi:hypothetical protein
MWLTTADVAFSGSRWETVRSRELRVANRSQAPSSGEEARVGEELTGVDTPMVAEWSRTGNAYVLMLNKHVTGT